MGPRCSSAETQVCHRSYVIAAIYTQVKKKKFLIAILVYNTGTNFYSSIVYNTGTGTPVL